MKTILAAGAALLAVPAIAQVASPPAPAHKAHTRADVQARVAEHFARMDTNRDGFVTRAEADAAHAAMRAKMKEHMAERLAKRSPADSAAAFDRLDTDRNGVLSRQEFEAGRVIREKRMMVMREHGKPADGKMGMHRMGGRMAGMHGKMFDMADANKDGRVSLQEAQAAALRHFDMVDANKDGQITREERMQMHQRMHEQRRPG